MNFYLHSDSSTLRNSQFCFLHKLLASALRVEDLAVQMTEQVADLCLGFPWAVKCKIQQSFGLRLWQLHFQAFVSRSLRSVGCLSVLNFLLFNCLFQVVAKHFVMHSHLRPSLLRSYCWSDSNKPSVRRKHFVLYLHATYKVRDFTEHSEYNLILNWCWALLLRSEFKSRKLA